MAITAVGQGYKWTNICYDYRTGSGITYGEIGKPIYHKLHLAISPSIL